ncbi:hypothetical protein GCM10010840_27480 [Deinococcus aerolatus]|uniref:Uncharacterized protein n=1 Tax=Deinococcus aerolatus TaxID=522487 RepID=A0ABQ2GDG3_9DEIO|nr:hypothetical protein GCM10010840_27480 [Deinococcus aerolatus]
MPIGSRQGSRDGIKHLMSITDRGQINEHDSVTRLLHGMRDVLSQSRFPDAPRPAESHKPRAVAKHVHQGL